MRKKLHIKDVQVSGRRVLTRVDFNVPLSAEGDVADDTRIRMALPTIESIIERRGRAVLMSHLGRPKGKLVESLRMRPVAARLGDLLGREVATAPDCVGETAEGVVARMADSDVVLLENLRFHEGETKNASDFSRRLSHLGDVYVDDAFGTAHRAHASTVGVTKHFETRAMGYLMERELENLGRATESPEHPYVAILGGAKVSDKIGVFENLIEKVDVFLVGGGMAFAFLKAGGGEIGESLLEEGSVETAQEILASAGRAGRRVVLPSDVVIAREASAEAESRIADARRIPKGWKGLDVGPASIEAFAAEVSGASMIVWNGPLGVFELEPFAAGTMKIARAVAARTASGAISIIGGGDSAAAVVLAGVADSITHISTGGGASLMFLEGKALPAVEVLSEAH